MSIEQSTPKSMRPHIGIFGKTNSGKSSLINTLTGQSISTVSEIKGTTTDPVYINMELHGVGPVTLIDTPGFDDRSDLGEKRIANTMEALKKTDLAIFLFSGDLTEDEKFIERIISSGTRIIYILSKTDTKIEAEYIKSIEKYDYIPFSIKNSDSKSRLIDKISNILNNDNESEVFITGDLVKEGDLVVLVMPQDSEAPKGRLIMPQVQTIRELLDRGITSVNTDVKHLENTLKSLSKKPDLIITDSQVFMEVFSMIPEDHRLTSFSVLMSKYKGDIDYFVESAKALSSLNENSKILIAEACTHPPLTEDIGTVKIPAMLRKKYGEKLKIDFVRGKDFLLNEDYDLIIHCGACMFNRKYVMGRVLESKGKGIPMTNYGVTIAYLKGILDHLVY